MQSMCSCNLRPHAQARVASRLACAASGASPSQGLAGDSPAAGWLAGCSNAQLLGGRPSAQSKGKQLAKAARRQRADKWLQQALLVQAPL